jgi:hypothetical protein
MASNLLPLSSDLAAATLTNMIDARQERLAPVFGEPDPEKIGRGVRQ